MNIEEMMEQIGDLRHNAMMTDANLCNRGEYEWELGTNIANALRAAASIFTPERDETDERVELCGVPVRITYDDPNKIKLWRSVK